MENQRGLFSTLTRAVRRRLSSSSRKSQEGQPSQEGPYPATDDSVEASNLPADPTNLPDTSSQSQRDAAAELIHFHASAVSLLQDNNIYVNFSTPGGAAMANERRELAKHGWYWGTITLAAAQRKLNGKPNGSFLVRDSISGPFQFSISFRSFGCTLHTRIDFIAGYWTICADRRYRSMVDLIEDTMREEGILCYVPSSTKLGPDFPIQLRIPVSRFVESSLQHLSRMAIRSHLQAIGKQQSVQQLPLPKLLIGYLTETTFDSL